MNPFLYTNITENVITTFNNTNNTSMGSMTLYYTIPSSYFSYTVYLFNKEYTKIIPQPSKNMSIGIYCKRSTVEIFGEIFNCMIVGISESTEKRNSPIDYIFCFACREDIIGDINNYCTITNYFDGEEEKTFSLFGCKNSMILTKHTDLSISRNIKIYSTAQHRLVDGILGAGFPINPPVGPPEIKQTRTRKIIIRKRG